MNVQCSLFIFLLSEIMFVHCLNFSDLQNVTDVFETKIKTKKLIVSTEETNYFRAIISCKQSGMELASISSQEEQSDLEYILKNIIVGSQSGVWISGTNLVETASEQFYWLLKGTVALYTNWCPGEPNNAGGVEHCMLVAKYDGVQNLCWNDKDCGNKFKYVCQSAQ